MLVGQSLGGLTAAAVAASHPSLVDRLVVVDITPGISSEGGPSALREFFAGPRMDRDRGTTYNYAADFNAVLATDGSDIVSGYSFLFGGWDDRGSQIVRGHEIVGENRRVAIPRDSRSTSMLSASPRIGSRSR